MSDSEKNSVDTPEKLEVNGAFTIASTEDAASSIVQRTARGPPPLKIKIMAILMVSAISFGSQWSSGVTGAMKSAIKKV